MFNRIEVTLRPSAKVSGPGRRDGRDAASAMSPPATTAARCADWVSHEPAAAELAGTETLSSTSDEMRSTEKTIPATAAARNVLKKLPACSAPWPNGPSVTGLPLLKQLAGRPRPLSALGRRGSSRGVRPFHDRALSAGRRHGPPQCRTNGARQP